MRVLGLSLLVLAACTETGAHLTFSAPNGPAKVTSFEVVLATPDRVPTVASQRTTPDALDTQPVSYFLQRTIAGGTHGTVDGVDGFAVRVEPDPSLGDTQFVPFVLMYDGDKLVAIATYRAQDTRRPSPILVVRDEIDKYVLDVEPVEQVSDTDEVGPGQVQVVECYRDDQSTFASGIAWRPAGGGEFRLLFPDDGGLDATNRVLDLDCDGHAVTVESSGPDCDDSRGWFHRDAQETCDGYDTNCDGLSTMVVACSGGTGTNVCRDPVTNTGVALCDDRTGTQSACESDPQCLCAQTPGGCPRCVISADAGAATSTVKPCQPSAGYVRLDPWCSDAARCSRVEVLAVGGGWKAELSPDVQPYTFGSVAHDVGPKVILRVKRPEGTGAEIAGTHGASTGDVTLGIHSADGSSHLRTLDLQLAEAPTSCDGSGPFAMVCFP